MIHVDMIELEEAFESRDHLFSYALDTQSGRRLVLPGYQYDDDIDEQMQADIDLVDAAPPGRIISLDPEEHDVRPTVNDAREFIRDVEDEGLRARLERALGQHRGAFRRFLDILHEEAGEIDRWHYFARQRLHANIAAYLASAGVRVHYDPLPAYQPRHDTRRHLLAGAARFVERVKGIDGVERIAVIGSITTAKREPNDVDFLITIATPRIVPHVAAPARKLKGHAQQINRGADVFLADGTNTYLGRTCPWRECGPGIRRACEAQNCGGHLYDDLHVIRLGREIIASPPLELWPKVVVRGDVPADVLEAFGIAR